MPNEAGELTDRALCLRRFPYGESSLVVHLLTRRHGRVHVLAKGAYRPTSGYFAVLDLFDTLEVTWRHQRGAELSLLVKGALVERRRGITEDLERYRAALAVLELAGIGARPGLEDPELFELSRAALDALDGRRDEPPPPALVGVVFELGFLQNLGLTPALEACAACGRPATVARGDRVAFSAGAGGRLCAAHAAEARASGRRVGTLPLSVVEAAAALARESPRAPSHRDLDPALLERVRDFVQRFLDYHLETRPKSHRAFLAKENRNAPELGPAPRFRRPHPPEPRPHPESREP